MFQKLAKEEKLEKEKTPHQDFKGTNFWSFLCHFKMVLTLHSKFPWVSISFTVSSVLTLSSQQPFLTFINILYGLFTAL